MHILNLNYWYEPELESPEALLERYRTLVEWSEALVELGAQVTVLQRFRADAVFERNHVRYVFVSDRHPPRLRKWQIPSRLHVKAGELCRQARAEGTATVVHLNGLAFPLQLKWLRRALPASAPIVAQDHADEPATGLRASLQRWGLKAADDFLFAASELARPWTERGLILPDRVHEVMEGSTKFRPEDRPAARAATGMCGDPVLLWVGRLNALKDPLTVLEGFELALHHAPAARLYMVYSSADLLHQVQARIAGSAALADAVILVGSIAHGDLAAMYSSADYFVSGSRKEGSGYALLEALACGSVPIVTDIPSFRAMTDGGKLGALWTPGDAQAFSAALLRVIAQPNDLLRDSVLRFYDAELSWTAIGRKAMAVYHQALARRAGIT
jgi:glycosyltransferase involved in cell wall biosynthesis